MTGTAFSPPTNESPFSVGVKVGATTLTRVPGARSADRDSAKPCSADFAVEIAQWLGNPERAATVEIKTRELLRSRGSRALTRTNASSTLEVKAFKISSVVSFLIEPKMISPGQKVRASIWGAFCQSKMRDQMHRLLPKCKNQELIWGESVIKHKSNGVVKKTPVECVRSFRGTDDEMS